LAILEKIFVHSIQEWTGPARLPLPRAEHGINQLPEPGGMEYPVPKFGSEFL
jgi:hypothetical protein